MEKGQNGNMIIRKNLKYFLISFLLSLSFWWGVNIFQENLEDFLFWQKMADQPQLLTAQIVQEEELAKLKPIRIRQIEDLKIEAQSAISVLIDPKGSQRILFEKEVDKKLPIASLTKLMTAKIVLENYDLSQVIEISKNAVEQEGDLGSLKIGEIFTIRDLLYLSLMESSNDATLALTEVIGEKSFVDLMNLGAQNLELKNTFFTNSTGLDPENLKDPINYSTARDLVTLALDLLKNQPKIWEISATSEFNLYSPKGVFHHKLKNTNELLGKNGNQFWPGARIIGGKTGWTPRAQGCLLLVMTAPKNQGVIINVILGSPDRFGEMEKLINWLNSAYKW